MNNRPTNQFVFSSGDHTQDHSRTLHTRFCKRNPRTGKCLCFVATPVTLRELASIRKIRRAARRDQGVRFFESLRHAHHCVESPDSRDHSSSRSPGPVLHPHDLANGSWHAGERGGYRVPPLEILVWEDADGEVRISYNSPALLQARHGLLQDLVQNIALIEALATRGAMVTQ